MSIARPTRNEIFGRLFALVAPRLTEPLGAAFFVMASRKFRDFSKVAAEQQPAFFQTEHSETITEKVGMPTRRTLHGAWVVYLRSDPADETDIAAAKVNDLIDALEGVLTGDNPDGRQTLGGLVQNVWIDGSIMKIPGDDDGQGMIVIPLSILVP